MQTIPYPIAHLFLLATVHGIEIAWYPRRLVGSTRRGRYIERKRPAIFLSPEIEYDEMRYRCTLAHELGHYFTGVGIWTAGKDDARANHWAQRELLPLWWLQENAWMQPWMMAESAGVYQEWVEERLGGLSAQVESLN